MEDVEYAQLYDSIVDSYDSGFAHNPGLLRLIEKINSRLPTSANILDIGCGTGNPVSSTLASSGHKVVGVDFSPEMVTMSQKNVPKGKFLVADMRHYEHPTTARPDAIFNVFASFRLRREETESLVNKWAGWLNPNGLLCIATMAADDCPQDRIENGYDPDGLCARAVRQRFMGNEFRHTMFTRRGWTDLLQRNNLEVVESWMEIFVPPGSMDTDDARFFYIIARKGE
ncbi:S-adenosyl-L-methionine-dependent methyltransferase [Aspergillus campestris IBT 28561]|uniref:S-adenosyl-L-methionine-dependent methyltransferase n=1 Tax=Aspergillus campestris (strain IBT 28561) TaxID=1392248 RepID=A0A2I1D555_ASPC2|nr:S-adenosyl-L-methionine-dependent methyltransferase [Aspergillus campestris IBT 28561]PKY05005.1 S-adenosyl-L-methionine-dependent methyltransferase [Aspergillus campestris IBT 28561]